MGSGHLFMAMIVSCTRTLLQRVKLNVCRRICKGEVYWLPNYICMIERDSRGSELSLFETQRK